MTRKLILPFLGCLAFFCYIKHQTKRAKFADYSNQEDLLNLELIDPRSRNIFFNRIEKCGSRTLIAVSYNLSARNDFKVVEELAYQKQLAGLDLLLETQRILLLAPPTFYQRHVLYIDFRKYPTKRPILINMIREPIARFVSHYSYEKYGDAGAKRPPPFPDRPDINQCLLEMTGVCELNNTRYFNMGNYFCGMDAACIDYTSDDRVGIAKRNIDTYTFIGSVDEFETSIKILERLLPGYFKGAEEVWNTYFRSNSETRTVKREPLSDESRALLKNRMKHEYEVYDYAMRKFDSLKKRYGFD